MNQLKIGYVLSLILFSLSSIQANPWGKDADLVSQSSCHTAAASSQCKTPVLGRLGEVMIQFHQEVISPADGPRSHFIPSSSQYTLDAMRRYGFFQGVAMGCDRLLRENKDPWVYRLTRNAAGETMKYDPVP